MTIRTELSEAEHRLRGLSTARRDAELLLRYVVARDRAWVIAHSDEELTPEQARQFESLVGRRHRGDPIQYILGETEFYGLPFRVTPDVLIPRPETEHLVEKALQLVTILKGSVSGHDLSRAENSTKEDGALAPAGSSSPVTRILDVGSGSGAIAVALARQLPQAQVTSVDISAAALEIARENAERNAVSTRIRFLQSDLLAAVAGELFNLIVSNPPYVPETDRASLSVEVRDHEPALALFAGDDGLAVYRRLIPQAFAALVSGGYLAMEIGYGQAQAVCGLMESTGFAAIETAPDFQGIPRVVWGRRA